MLSRAMDTPLRFRVYGDAGPPVVLLHGGPGAPGHMAPVAAALADSFRVYEPFQRGSGEAPLTVARHIADLQAFVMAHCGAVRPAVVGFSWGAMLALAYAAAHPQQVGSLALVSCGTFDPRARAQLQVTLHGRMTPDLQQQLDQLAAAIPDPDVRLCALGELLLPLYAYDLLTTQLGNEGCDARAHEESWADMVRLQEAGVYPAAFAAITAPVLMLHGAADPHPGSAIRESLAPYLPQLAYQQLDRCGHYPWLERHARDDFFRHLRQWLGQPELVGPS